MTIGSAVRAIGGKSNGNFAPIGPFLVPRAFVPDHMNHPPDRERLDQAVTALRDRLVADDA
jgi:hypothetical protein